MARPLKYTVEEVENLIDQYFETTGEDRQTITGLALLFGSKQLMNDYEKRDEFTDKIREAKLKIENSYEISLRGKTPTGAIFALKNMGWHDKTESDVKISGKLSIEPKEWTDGNKTE